MSNRSFVSLLVTYPVCQIPVRGARQSLLTDFSPRIGPLLVRLSLEKWALSSLRMTFRLNVHANYQNEMYLVIGI